MQTWPVSPQAPEVGNLVPHHIGFDVTSPSGAILRQPFCISPGKHFTHFIWIQETSGQKLLIPYVRGFKPVKHIISLTSVTVLEEITLVLLHIHKSNTLFTRHSFFSSYSLSSHPSLSSPSYILIPIFLVHLLHFPLSIYPLLIPL